MSSLNVGELNYALTLDATKLTSSLNQAARAAQTSGKRVGDGIETGVERGTVQAGKHVTDLTRHTQRQASKMSNGMKLAITAGVAAAAAGLYQLARVGADQVKKSINEASKWEQAVGALDSVYGKNADGLRRWSNEQWKVGLSANEAATQVTLFGANLKASGFTSGEAAKQAKNLTALSADLAAMFGGTTQEAGTAIGATLRGEFDSIERYGVAITADLVKATAISEGIVKSLSLIHI